MDAEKYIVEHWIPRRVWTHLAWPRHQERLRRCAELMPAAGRVVDVGCACGHSTEIMRRFRPELEWMGADFSLTAVERARKRFPGMAFHSLRGPEDIHNLGQVEGVVCSEVLEHVEDEETLAQGLLMLAAGTLVVTTPWKRVSDPGHLRVHTEASLRRLFTRPWPSAEIHVETRGEFFYLVARRLP